MQVRDGCDSGSLSTYPGLGRRECYGAILPPSSINHTHLRVISDFGVRPRLTSHPEVDASRRATAIMGKAEKMDPVWDDLDR